MRPLLRAAALFVAAITVTVVSAQSGQQPPRFVARGEVVRLDVLVNDRGRPIAGLKPDDFTVFDNDVPQTIDFLSTEELPLNVILNFDVSGSVAGQKLQDLRAAGRAVLDSLHAGDRAALVSFTQAVSLRAELTADVPRLRTALDQAQPRGQTAIIDASLAGLVVGTADAGRSLMLTFSDGVDTASALPPAAVIDIARRTEVVVFGVTTGKLRTAFLKDLADTTGGDTVEIQSTAELRSTLVRLLNEYRQRYLLAYSPTGVAPAGFHAIKVQVSKKGATVKTRQGYER
jgi:VWFA-related protein